MKELNSQILLNRFENCLELARKSNNVLTDLIGKIPYDNWCVLSDSIDELLKTAMELRLELDRRTALN